MLMPRRVIKINDSDKCNFETVPLQRQYNSLTANLSIKLKANDINFYAIRYPLFTVVSFETVSAPVQSSGRVSGDMNSFYLRP